MKNVEKDVLTEDEMKYVKKLSKKYNIRIQFVIFLLKMIYLELGKEKTECIEEYL